MDAKKTTSFENVVEIGKYGVIACVLVFVPSCLLTNSMWSRLFFEVLNKRSNINIDDHLLIYACFPIALLVSLAFGYYGGKLGMRVVHSNKGSIIGSIIGGIVAGVLTSSWLTFIVVRGWATYYDIK